MSARTIGNRLAHMARKMSFNVECNCRLDQTYRTSLQAAGV